MFCIASTSWASSLSRSNVASLYFAASRSPTLSGLSSLSRTRSCLIERVEQVVLDRTEAAALPELLPLRPPVRRAPPAPAAPDDGKDLRGLAQQAGGVLADVADDLLALFGPGQNVDLVDDEDDLLAPLPDLLQEGPLALGEGAVGRGDEQDQIGAGNEVAGQLLVAADDRVGARGVHDVDLAEHLGGMGTLQQVGLAELFGHLGPMAENVDAVGGRGDAFGQYPLARAGR